MFNGLTRAAADSVSRSITGEQRKQSFPPHLLACTQTYGRAPNITQKPPSMLAMPTSTREKESPPEIPQGKRPTAWGLSHLRRGHRGGRKAVDAHPPHLACSAGPVVEHLVARHRGGREGEDEGVHAGPAAAVPQRDAPGRVGLHLQGEGRTLRREGQRGRTDKTC